MTAWRFENHRHRALSKKLTAKEKKLLDPFEGLLQQNDEDEAGTELVDIVDTQTGKIVALYARWPIYSGALIDVASGEVLADVVDGYFDAHGDDALRERVRAAEEEAKPRITLPERVDYRAGRDAPKQGPAPAATPDDPALLAEIRALRAELDATKGKERNMHTVMDRIDTLLPKLFGAEPRPYPLRRPFELTEAQRAILEIAVDHYEWKRDLSSYGLLPKGALEDETAPGSPGSPLARLVGKRPPQPLDATITIDGAPHPLWAIASDVLIGVRPDSVYVTALEAQPLDARAGAWRQLARRDEGFGVLHPRDKKEAQRGWADVKAQGAYNAHYLALVRETFARLGDRGEAAARSALAEPVPENAFDRDTSDVLRLAAFDGLAQLAKKAGGVLDASHDAVIADIALRGRVPNEPLVALFRELPPERAREMTGLHYILLPLFPSESGLARLLERMSSNVEWQHPKGTWAKIATQLAGKFGATMLPQLVSAKAKLTRHRDGLDKAIEAAKKAAAKKATPKKATAKKPKKK
jgi:hypothetical protein